MTSYKKGLLSEIGAIILLWMKGYRILKWRFRTDLGEIDIIAKRGSLIVFAEVKKRATRLRALEAIDMRSRRRIENAARLFLQNNPLLERFEVRFDVIPVSLGFLPGHLKKAWIFGE